MSARREPRPFRPPWPINQFVLPRGLLGRIAGEAMARVNAGIEARAIEVLELDDDARALEIGFGPGVGISMLAKRVARVAGIDPSQTMLDMASGRNRRAIAQGKVDLRLGTAAELPWPDASFDAALSVNNVHLWDLEPSIHEIHRALAPGGRLAIALYFVIIPSSSPRYEDYLAELLREGGFNDVDVHREWVRFAPALICSARR